MTQHKKEALQAWLMGIGLILVLIMANLATM